MKRPLGVRGLDFSDTADVVDARIVHNYVDVVYLELPRKAQKLTAKARLRHIGQELRDGRAELRTHLLQSPGVAAVEYDSIPCAAEFVRNGKPQSAA